MEQLPVLRVTLVMIAVAVAAVGLGLAVGLRTGNVTWANVTLLTIGAAGMAVVMRWWLRMARAAGIRPGPRPTRARWITSGLLLLTILVVLTLEVAAYSATHSRLAEIAVVAVALPIMFALTRLNYAQMPDASPKTAALLRSNVVVFSLVTLLTAVSSWSWLRHADGSVGDNVAIALSFVSIAAAPLTAYFNYRRYKRAVHTTPAR